MFSGLTAFMTNEAYLRVASSLYECPNCLKQSVRTRTHAHRRTSTLNFNIKIQAYSHSHTTSPHKLTEARTPHTDTLEIMSESLHYPAGPGDFHTKKNR